jgi:GxxExxY protein
MNLIDKCKSIASEIFNDLGSGFDEPIYQKAFEVSLRLETIQYENQKIIPIFYKGFNIGEGKIDLIPQCDNDLLIIELKAIVAISPKDITQLKKYMELLNAKQGLLINFPQVGTSKKETVIQEPEFIILSDKILITNESR